MLKKVIGVDCASSSGSLGMAEASVWNRGKARWVHTEVISKGLVNTLQVYGSHLLSAANIKRTT